MHWLKERGVIANWWDFENLPFAVIEDAHLVMEAEAIGQKLQAQQKSLLGARKV